MYGPKGVSLIEFLVVVAIIAILLGVGSIHLPRDRFAVDQAAQGLARDIQLARFEAIRLNWYVGIHIEPGIEASRYLLYCDNPNCLDPDSPRDPSASNRRFDGDGTETVLKTVLLGRAHGSLATIRSASQTNRIVFDPRGLPAALINQTIEVGNLDGSYTREVVVSVQGNARLQ